MAPSTGNWPSTHPLPHHRDGQGNGRGAKNSCSLFRGGCRVRVARMDMAEVMAVVRSRCRWRCGTGTRRSLLPSRPLFEILLLTSFSLRHPPLCRIRLHMADQRNVRIPLAQRALGRGRRRRGLWCFGPLQDSEARKRPRGRSTAARAGSSFTGSGNRAQAAEDRATGRARVLV